MKNKKISMHRSYRTKSGFNVRILDTGLIGIGSVVAAVDYGDSGNIWERLSIYNAYGKLAGIVVQNGEHDLVEVEDPQA